MKKLSELKIILLLSMIWMMSSSSLLTTRGAGITPDQEQNIVRFSRDATNLYRTNLFFVAQYIEDLLTENYRQDWVVQVFTAGNFVSGRSGIKTNNQQWVQFYLSDLNLWYWVWVPAHLGSFNMKFEKTVERGLNQKGVSQHGTGISSSDEVLILNYIRNAALSKGNDIQANAVMVEQKLEDAFGQNWVVEIYGGDGLKWGRSGVYYLKDQWLFEANQGDHVWTYFIWVPGAY